ncbi:hypothetical protein AVEN_68821-1 [Araneus ventricosus]|uniref:Putative nuclease HARBI1 n=1 Tax=Araneus ventricosus TaxID=182803 RepID=A0A4Y2C8A3_ARAVE|nr:hypothetical protein AVEN_68821-1 [Araneus ventricosus]
MGGAGFSEILNDKTISGNSEYHELLNRYKERLVAKLNSTFSKAIKHNTLHFIPTSGPSVTARTRRLHPAQLKVAKQEFEYMLEKGICRPSQVTGDPGYQKGIGAELGVSEATVSRTVNAVVDSIIAHANEWIKFPTTNSEITEAKQLWHRKYKFPTAISVIDCTHIGILKPKLYEDEYINRKGKPTLNVQATCYAKEMFTSVGISWPGSVHDSRIWKTSQVYLPLRNKSNAVLNGYRGYGMEPCLMTPLKTLLLVLR